MSFRINSIRRRMVLIVLLALAPAGVLALGALRGGAARPDVHGALLQSLDGAVQREEPRLRATRALLVSLAQLLEVSGGTAARCATILGDIAARSPAYAAVVAADAEGRVSCSTGSTVPTALVQAAFVRRALAERRFTVGEAAGTSGGLACAYPIAGPHGPAAGVLVAVLASGGPGGAESGPELLLAEPDGLVAARLSGGGPRPTSTSAVFAGETGVIHIQGDHDVQRLLAYRRLQVDPAAPLWLIATPGPVGAPAPGVWSPRHLAFGGLALALVVGVGFLAQRLVVQPVDRLLAGASRLGNGDPAARTGLAHGEDELGRLARAYDEMAETLERSDTRLRATLADLADSLGFRLLVESVKDYAIYMIDAEGRVSTWNQGAERIHGYPRADVLRRNVACFYTPEDQQAGKPASELRQALVEGRVEDLAWRVRKDGSRFWASVTTTAIRDSAGRLRGYSQVTRDLTERRQAEETLRGLSQRLLMAQEEERRRIARELHDEIGQVLTSAKFNLQWLQRGGGGGADVAAARLEASIAHIDRVIGEVRSLSLRLRPSILDELGLVPALRWYLAGVALPSECKLHVTLDSSEERLPIAIEVACFRVVQEALTNVVRYAHARNVEVELSALDDRLVLHVRDDGEGFDLAVARARAAEGACMGLAGMRERVSLAGGTLELTSTPGGGTQVRASFPLPSGAAAPASPAGEAGEGA